MHAKLFFPDFFFIKKMETYLLLQETYHIMKKELGSALFIERA